MRRLLLFLAVFLVVASAATGVHASTDCERWFIAYKNSIAQAQTATAKHLVAAKHRVHRYVHRKLAALQKPKPANKPKVLDARFQRPKMTREEALRRFNLACGDLPEVLPIVPQQIVQAEVPKPDYLALHSEMPTEGPAGESLLAKNVVPSSLGGGNEWGQSGSYPPGFGGVGGGGLPPGKSNPNNPPGGNPPTDPPIPPPVPPVPEPGSIVLMLTGIASAAGVARRRFAR